MTANSNTNGLAKEAKFSALRRFEELPGNWKFVRDNKLSMPSNEVLDVFLARLSHFDLVPTKPKSVIRALLDRSIDVQYHMVTVTMDMVVDFMRACTFFKGQVLGNPSILVHAFLEEWHKMDKENYFAFLKALGLDDAQILPHQMPMMRFESLTQDDKLANLRCWTATRLIGSVESDQVPNIFDVDYVCGIKGTRAYEIVSEGIWVNSRPAGLYQISVISEDGARKKISQLVTAGMDRQFANLHQGVLEQQKTQGHAERYSALFPYNPKPGQMLRGYTQRYGDGG